MKVALIAAGFALLTLGTPANASWAENANMAYPVFTGTNASLARAQAGRYGYSRYPRYPHRYSGRVRHHGAYYR
jgi:hypothetical protein